MTQINVIRVNGKELLTLEATACALECSLSTVRRMVTAKRLQRVRVLGRWLIDFESINDVIEARE